VVFDYTPTHARDGPVVFLRGSGASWVFCKRTLTADTTASTRVATAPYRSCLLAHARNKFKDAQATDPERALVSKAWIRKLYDVEDEAKAKIARLGMVAAEAAAVLLRLRQEKSVPLLRRLNSVLNQWQALKPLHNGRRPATSTTTSARDAEVDRHRPQQLPVCRQRSGRHRGGRALQLPRHLHAPRHRHVRLPPRRADALGGRLKALPSQAS